MKALEKRFELKTAPINEFSTSWHHQTPSMIYKGNFSESDITDPLFPVFQLSKVFMILNVYNSFKQYFKMISIRINIAKNIHTDFNLLSFQIKHLIYKVFLFKLYTTYCLAFLTIQVIPL